MKGTCQWNHRCNDGFCSFILSLRVKFAVENEAINQLHGSASLEEAQREINFFFPKQRTLAVIKPDVVGENKGTSWFFKVTQKRSN